MKQAYAAWLIGPVGSGKSTLAKSIGQRFRRVIDQDPKFEELLLAEKLPLDFRLHQQVDLLRISELRALASKACWDMLPRLRRQQYSFLIQTTGDKPILLRHEVELNRQFGYIDLAMLIDCSLNECQQHNGGRKRVLPRDVVSQSWHAFQDSLKSGMYSEIFQADRIAIVHDAMGEEPVAWLDRQMGCVGND